MLEDFCLLDCFMEDHDFDGLNDKFPAVLCHRKPLLALKSRTWVKSSHVAHMP